MAKLLYIGTAGTDDPTRATFPFLLAKGALDAGHEAGIILMGEAAPLILVGAVTGFLGGGASYGLASLDDSFTALPIVIAGLRALAGT